MKNQTYVRKVSFTPSKAMLMMKFPCQVSLQLRIGNDCHNQDEQLTQTRNVYKFQKGICQFNETLMIKTNCSQINQNNQCFSQQATIYVLGKLSKGEVPIGSYTFCIEQETELGMHVVRLKNCLDPNGNIAYRCNVQYQRSYPQQIININKNDQQSNSKRYKRDQETRHQFWNMYPTQERTTTKKVSICNPEQQTESIFKLHSSKDKKKLKTQNDQTDDNTQFLNLKLYKALNKIKSTQQQKNQISLKCMKLQRQIQKLLEKQKKHHQQNTLLYEKLQKKTQQANELQFYIKQIQNSIQCANRQVAHSAKLLEIKQKAFQNEVKILKDKYIKSQQQKKYMLTNLNEQIQILLQNQKQYASKALQIQKIYFRQKSQLLQNVSQLTMRNKQLQQIIIQKDVQIHEYKHKNQITTIQMKELQRSIEERSVNQQSINWSIMNQEVTHNHQKALKKYEQQCYQLTKKLHKIQIDNSLLDKKYKQILQENKSLIALCKEKQDHIKVINNQYEKIMGNFQILKIQLKGKQEQISTLAQLTAENQLIVYEKDFILKVQEQKTQFLHEKYRHMIQENNQILQNQKEKNSILSTTILKKEQQISILFEEKQKLIQSIETIKQENQIITQNQIIQINHQNNLEQNPQFLQTIQELQQLKIQRRKLMNQLSSIKEKNNQLQKQLQSQHRQSVDDQSNLSSNLQQLKCS